MGEREQRSMLQKPRSMLEVAPKSIFDGYQSPSSLLEMPRSSQAVSAPTNSSGVNHNYGNVSVHPPREAEQAGANPYLSTMDTIGDRIGAVTDADDFLEILPDGFNDGLTTLSSAAGLGSGMEKLSRGEYWDGGMQTAKSFFGMADGIAGLAGYGKASNIAGGISSSIGAVDNFKKAWTSDDLGEATQSARGVVNDGLNAAADFAGGNATPWGMGLKGVGLSAKYLGTPISNYAEKVSEQRGDYHNDAGMRQSASAEAGDWGRSVDDAFGHSTWSDSKLGWLADHALGGPLGAATAIGGGIITTGGTYLQTGANAVSDAAGAAKDFLFGGPGIMDIARQQIAQQAVQR